MKIFPLLILIVMTQGYETQPYEVIDLYDDFELRYYPSVAMVQTESSPGSEQNFRALFQYISGSNESKLKIAMTTPVHMEKTEGKNKMAFVLPSNLKEPPTPKNKNVQIIRSKAAHFAAIEYGGYSNSNKSKYYTKLLQESLSQNGIKRVGSPIVLGYNSPYKFINRRNEIIIEVVLSE
ncbi:heme-binding protein [Flavobacteriaceae bacterium]|nr:heme-binding protein [Flavobacteriaceae bacterium]MDA7797522.1 heme-binding protein [Flavobacteriaceae bacterium]MDA8948692.1 heme-binding protein [Flavobacteriaceae bacterium]MDA9016000.1 heme-binding protein [Flavobacteriaceae bacterium]